MRRNIQLHLNLDDATQNTNDPLWHSKHMLNHVNKVFATYGHCLGALSLDELTLATKCRTRAKSHLPMKPDPYGLRLHGLSGAGPNCMPCLFSLVNNGLGDISGILQVKKYLSQHSNLRTTYEKCIVNNKMIESDSASALWALQMH